MQEATLKKLKRTGKALAKLLKEEGLKNDTIAIIALSSDGYVSIAVDGESWASVRDGAGWMYLNHKEV